MNDALLSDEELLRYSRQLMLPQFDVAGQEALRRARVLIVGLGGLGCPAAIYLAAAGVGSLILADADGVELSNLQRQIAHTSARIGVNKAASAAQLLRDINPHVRLDIVPERLAGERLRDYVAEADVALDCCDNFATRFDLNAAAFAAKVPLVSAAAIRLEGQLSVFDPRRADSPCYRCLYDETEELDQSCARNGVLAPLVGVLGSLQALECIKLLSGMGSPLVGKLLLFDALQLQFRELRLRRNSACPVCGD
ncbi:MAG: molybdopterin-synthase adenylyltransferase MoeB [Pseudomonadales bacterium]|jgi:adenylyltransferase/sulfurtransferase|nr:molybdopterin-synthase adenylyltransferase MoeB [Pseudomonadales bacterium]